MHTNVLLIVNSGTLILATAREARHYLRFLCDIPEYYTLCSWYDLCWF